MQPSVLLVDDNPFVLRWVSGQLQRMGLIPACARDGREAMLRICGQQFPLVIVDLGIAFAAGKELMHVLRELQPEAKLIATTTGNAKCSGFAAELQVDAMLHKPFSMDRLYEAVHNALTLPDGSVGQPRSFRPPQVRSALDLCG